MMAVLSAFPLANCTHYLLEHFLISLNFDTVKDQKDKGGYLPPRFLESRDCNFVFFEKIYNPQSSFVLTHLSKTSPLWLHTPTNFFKIITASIHVPDHYIYNCIKAPISHLVHQSLQILNSIGFKFDQPIF